MDNRPNWPDWLRKPARLIWTISTSIPSIIALVNALKGNYYLGAVVFIVVVLVNLLVILAYYAFTKLPPEERGFGATIEEPKYRPYRPLALAGLFIIIAIVVALIAIKPSRSFVFVAFVGTPKPTAGTPFAAPTAGPGEILILLTEFKAEAGTKQYAVSQRIHDELSADLRELTEKDVTVRQVPEVVESSAEAVALGERYGAITVIWGFYDDLGISVNVEAVWQGRSLLVVPFGGLEVEISDRIRFEIYIGKEMPKEISFITALVLYQASVNQGRMDKALGYLAMASRNLPEDPEIGAGGAALYLMQALDSYLSGNLEQAVEQLGQAIAETPNSASLYTARGTIFALLGEGNPALEDFEKAIALEPNNTLPYGLKAATLWYLGDIDGALDILNQAVALDSNDPIVHTWRGHIGLQIRDLTLALDAWNKVDEIVPDSRIVPIYRGLVHEWMGWEKNAANDYDRALEINVSPVAEIQAHKSIGEYVPAHAYLFACTAYKLQERFEEAVESCDKALEIDSDRVDARWKRGQLYAAQGKLENAIADYSAAIQADPSWPWLYYLRAQAWVELGQTDKAHEDLVRALELDPVDELRQQIQALQENTSQ